MYQMGNGFPGSPRTKTISLILLVVLLSGALFYLVSRSSDSPEQHNAIPKAHSKNSNGKVSIAGKEILLPETTTTSPAPTQPPTTKAPVKKSTPKKKQTTVVATTQPIAPGTTGKDLNLADYFPGVGLNLRYLDGTTSRGARSVLWFEQTGNDGNGLSFEMYNTDPDVSNSDCHADKFQWTTANLDGGANPSGNLAYNETVDSCNVSASKPSTSIVYSPGIVFLPKIWNDNTRWSVTGDTNAIYRENGVAKCVGINHYTNQITGYETLRGVKVIHWTTTQTTTWKSGPGSTYTGCAPGQVTRWEEHHYFADNLPLPEGGSAKGFYASVGGNKDINYPNWDIVFSQWAYLPQ